MNNTFNIQVRHRHCTGEHLIWLQRKQRYQHLQQQHCQRMSERPGFHCGNIHRQNTAYAMLKLFAMLSQVRSDNTMLVSRTKNSDLLSINQSVYSVNTPYPRMTSPTTVLPSPLSLRSSDAHCPTRWIKPADSTLAIMTRTMHKLINEMGEFIVRYDPLKLPIATALSITERPARRLRYAIQPTKKTTPVPSVDDVTRVKLYDFSCLNEGKGYSFAEILKKISETLQRPVTQLTVESINIDSWRKGQGCPTSNDIEKVTQITEITDYIISQIIAFLPHSQPLAIAQSIVAPLLARVANDLQDNPSSPDQDLNLLQEIIQQARISIATTHHEAQISLTRQPVTLTAISQLTLPIFIVKNGINHIDLVHKGNIYRSPVSDKNGHVYASVPKGNKGRLRRCQVYFNYLTQQWRMTGNGRFNRFSKKEQQLVHRLSLSAHFLYQHQNGNKPAIYTVLNPYTVPAERLSAVEMFGQLVPFRYDYGTHQPVIYDAAQKQGPVYEIVLARNEWHLKLPADKKVKFVMLFSPEYGRTLKVDMIREIHGQKIYAQVNTDSGFLWGQKFVCNQHGHLELLSPQGKQDKYYKNSIRTPLLSEIYKTTRNEKKHQPKNDDVMSYDRDTGCFRVKRGAAISHMCTEGSDGSPYRSTQDLELSQYPVIAEGSIGIVYDYQEDRVIKKYKGKIDERHKSRLLAANNNAKGFNRFYGASSATIEITSNGDGSSSALVRLKKVAGTPLDRIKTIKNKDTLKKVMNRIKSDHPAKYLSGKLQRLGIIHNDINKGNIIYDEINGFQIIDFDSANYLPEGTVVSSSMTNTMKNKFNYVFNDVLRDISLQLTQLNEVAASQAKSTQ